MDWNAIGAIGEIVGAVQKLTGIRPAQGVHSFFVTETAGPQSNPAIGLIL